MIRSYRPTLFPCPPFPNAAHWLLLGAVAASLCLGACSSVGNSARGALTAVTPYKVEVVQGNFVSKEQVAALKPGMSRQQVREILGTSLLTDVFHSNRWDYVFTIRRQGVEPQQRRLTLYFNGELLERFEGDPMPSEEEFVAHARHPPAHVARCRRSRPPTTSSRSSIRPRTSRRTADRPPPRLRRRCRRPTRRSNRRAERAPADVRPARPFPFSRISRG